MLLEIIKALKHDSEFVYDYIEELEAVFEFFDIPLDVLGKDTEKVICQVAKKAIDLDPENREAYEIIMDLPMELQAMRKFIEPCLMKMVDIFPEDHLACLKLAHLFYLKNAYRKAENILLQAYSRAPHDMQVREKYALSFIIASVRNLKRKNFNLVDKDLGKAEKFNIRSLNIYITEKKLISNAVKTNKFSREIFDENTKDFSLYEKMKTLLLFKLDMEDPSGVAPEKARGFVSIFNSFKKKVKIFSSNELYSLLKSLKKTYHMLFWNPFFASPLIDGKGQLLSSLGNGDFTNIIIDLVEHNYLNIVIIELEKRRKAANPKTSVIFDFYYIALCHFQGSLTQPSRFEDIIARTDALDDLVREVDLKRKSPGLKDIAGADKNENEWI
ncbi:MAG: hypothetical protein GXP56_19535 [Deltaproteobacteria bacterium]|nr:hypothetical protein [Deltaproteobacteria bacterium]